MRSQATILHLDLDAFFATVEQRDKPSLRGKPVIVGGIGTRGVVSTASYEARPFGVHSAMPTHEARRLCPNAAYLAGRFRAYRASSMIVMGILHEVSPLVEPLSLDEAFVDLLAADLPDHTTATLTGLAERVRAGGGADGRAHGVHRYRLEQVHREDRQRTRQAQRLPHHRARHRGRHDRRPAGARHTRRRPGHHGAPEPPRRPHRRRHPRAQPRRARPRARQGVGEWVHALAFARDDRPVAAERDAKSISVEDTFETDLTDRADLDAVIDRDAAIVAERVAKQGFFARTVTLKAKRLDFTTLSRSLTLHGATDRADVIARTAKALLDGVPIEAGFRLLGVGVAGFVPAAQEELFTAEDTAGPVEAHTEHPASVDQPERPRWRADYVPGADVVHDTWGPGWVWGAGLGRVTVRFETAETPPGPVRTFRRDDPALHLIEELPLVE